MVEKLFKDPYDYDVSLEPGSESARGKAALMDGVIGKMREIADSHAIPLVILFIPSKFDASELEGLVSPDPDAYPDYRRRNLSDLAVTGAARRGIAHIDLFDVFWRERAQGLYFVADDDHWNDRGQALAAELTSDLILREGWLAE